MNHHQYKYDSLFAVYEVGWGKKLSYVIAISKDEVQDVTWRYSADHAALKSRRNLVREQWLTAMLLKLTNKCQESYGESTKRGLTERRLRELVDLMSPKDKSKLTKEELLGRQSGSAAWRTARGELGLGTAAPANVVWRLTQEEKDSLTFHLEYDIVKVGLHQYISFLPSNYMMSSEASTNIG